MPWWHCVLKLSTTQYDARQRVLYPLQFGNIQFRHSKWKCVAVVEAKINDTASDGLDNFIRQRLPDMPQGPDVMVARSACIFHVLIDQVEWQLPVESDSKASNARCRLMVLTSLASAADNLAVILYVDEYIYIYIYIRVCVWTVGRSVGFS